MPTRIRRRRKRKVSRRARVEPVAPTVAQDDDDENQNENESKKKMELNTETKSKYRRVIHEQQFYGFLQAIGIGVDLKNYFSKSNESGYYGLKKNKRATVQLQMIKPFFRN